MEFLLPRPFAPGSESSTPERSLPGTFAPWNSRSLDGLPIHRRSPILVLTRSDVAELG